MSAVLVVKSIIMMQYHIIKIALMIMHTPNTPLPIFTWVKKPLLSHLNYMQNLLSCLKVRAVKTLTRLMNMQNILKDLYSHIDPPKMTYIFSTGLHLMAFSVKRTMILILMGVYYIKSESCIMRGRVVKGMLSWPINIL